MVTTELIDEIKDKKYDYWNLLVGQGNSDFPWDPAAEGIPPGLPHPYHFKNYTGEDLRNWRIRSGLYVTHCAKIANISPRCWRSYERGERPVPSYFFIILFYIQTLKNYFFVRRAEK